MRTVGSVCIAQDCPGRCDDRADDRADWPGTTPMPDGPRTAQRIM